MLKELAFIGGLITASLPLNSPVTPINREFMNSTDYEFSINYDSSKVLTPHSARNFEDSPSFFTDTQIYVVSESGKPNDVYYWINQVDNEQEVLLTFYEIPVANTFAADIPDLTESTIAGIQLFQKKSIVGETYYLLTGDFSNGANLSSGNLIEGKTAEIKGHGLVSLEWIKNHAEKGLTAYVAWKVNGSTIANNSLTNGGTSQEELTNMMLYSDGWDNKITFTSGYYGRAYNILGYAELNSSLFSHEFVGYASRTASGDISISLEPLTVGFDLVALAFSSLGSFLSYMIAPGITVGVILMVPVILCLILFIIKLVKKG